MAKDDLLAALIAEPLSPFEGRDVIRSAVEIPGAGGGLHEAMAFEPVELHKDQEVFVLIRTTVRDVKFKSIKDTQALARVHVLEAKEASFVDAGFAQQHLDEQAERIQRLREKAINMQEGTDGDPDDSED